MAVGQIEAKAGSRLNWHAEFSEPAAEALFRRTMQTHDACQLRYALCSAAGLFLAFSLADYALLGPGGAFLSLLLMRVGVALCCLALTMATLKRPALAQRPLPVNLICLICLTGLMATIPLRPDQIGIHLASMIFASMVLYLFVPNRFPWILTWNAYLAAGVVTAMLIWSNLPPELIFTSLLLLGFVNLLGSLTLTRLNRLQRTQFASLLEERAINRRLQSEIEERCQLEERLRHMATTDELTGIANRRHFFELASRELSRALRERTPLAICMVDIDHFKQLNDRHGHATGDRVLAAVAACCQSVLRDTDIIGRYGGEEFVLALPNAELHTAASIGERLREKVTNLTVPTVDDLGQLSVTVGISRLEATEVQLEASLLRADQALYAGKARGRNCVVIADPQAPSLSAVKA
ncbi:GGDEF domain-containing protein [Halomonas sp. NO4]|uniref:GGDEF domain-containing protein n=1 Tax=Halomonas sp. NO4 TaxID=2484813 RepID=UPI0013CF8639|nr:GGDEF domain-containing protein [Halomonas sp. NO4]